VAFVEPSAEPYGPGVVLPGPYGLLLP
jgi:hypothetical protein